MLRRGRLGSQVDEEYSRYTSSTLFDRNLFRYDLLGSMAHTKMLAREGIIAEEVATAILSGLREILRRGYSALELQEHGDIHMAVEAELGKLIGRQASELHTARSRNDQIALDLRMLAREEIISVAGEIINFEKVLLRLTEEHRETLMSGYTHLQTAQPVTLAHYLLAHFHFFLGDLERLRDAFPRVNTSPLGACALATSSFPLDKDYTSRLLGFEGSFENSQHAVASRDFLLEPMACLAISAINLTRVCDEIILWSSGEFGFVELPERFSSTSSIMPQKKNPDALEVMRARASIAAGNLSPAFTLTKSLPLAYNRDLQELSPLALSSFRMLRESFSLLAKLFSALRFDRERLRKSLDKGSPTATELADFLVREEKLGFREAHQIVGRALRGGKLSPEDIRAASKELLGREIVIGEEKLKEILEPRQAVESRRVEGSPSPESVDKAVARGKKKIRALEEFFAEKKNTIDGALEKLGGC